MKAPSGIEQSKHWQIIRFANVATNTVGTVANKVVSLIRVLKKEPLPMSQRNNHYAYFYES